MIVFDASGSMALAHRGQTKIDTARQAVGAVLPDITELRKTGLVTYAGCSRIELRVPPAFGSAPDIIAKLAATRARGDTPLTRAVSLAHAALRKAGETGVVVLVTDGLESCSDSPCRFGTLAGRRAPGIAIHVIGFALGPRHAVDELRCLANATGGTFAEVSDLDRLRNKLRELLGCPMLS
ncbi:MAG: vWA domain-containing protein [Pseudomonadota bacterium]